MSAKSLLDILNTERQKVRNHRFGSDYYARLASNPSGGKIKERESNDDRESLSTSPVETPSQSKTIKGDDVDGDKYPAMPAKVISDEELQESEKIEPKIQIEKELNIKDTSDADTTISEITSDSDMSYVNCYDVEKAKIYRRPSDEVAKPKINGVLYKQKDENDIVLDIITRQLVDENHNSEYIDKKDIFEISIINKNSEEEKTDEQVKQTSSKLNIVEMKLKSNIKEINNCDESSTDSSLATYEDVQQYEDKEKKFERAAISGNSTPHYQKFTVTKEIKVPQYKTNLERKIDISLAQARARRMSQSEHISEGNKATTTVIVNKKSDNTLIKKIYSDPSVRSFALSSRENLPIIISEEDIKLKQDDKHRSTSALNSDMYTSEMIRKPLQRSMSSSVLKDNNLRIRSGSIQRSTSATPTYDSDSVSEIMLSMESCGYSKSESSRSLILESDPEIAELKEKKLVASRLGEISKSFPNVSKIQGVKMQKTAATNQNTSMSTSSLDVKPKSEQSPVSVRDLKKKFEMPDAPIRKDKHPICSLTARSLSKQLRENLKNQKVDEPLSIEVIKCESPRTTPEPIVEVKTEEPILSTENKIKFYEKLNE